MKPLIKLVQLGRMAYRFSFYCKKLNKSCKTRLLYQRLSSYFHSRPALAQQHKYVEKLSKRGGSEEAEAAGYLLAVEHDPVYTVGMRARKDYRNQVKLMIAHHKVENSATLNIHFKGC